MPDPSISLEAFAALVAENVAAAVANAFIHDFLAYAKTVFGTPARRAYGDPFVRNDVSFSAFITESLRPFEHTASRAGRAFGVRLVSEFDGLFPAAQRDGILFAIEHHVSLAIRESLGHTWLREQVLLWQPPLLEDSPPA